MRRYYYMNIVLIRLSLKYDCDCFKYTYAITILTNKINYIFSASLATYVIDEINLRAPLKQANDGAENDPLVSTEPFSLCR